MKKRNQYLLLCCVLISFSSTLSAQQTPSFADYNYNTLLINPAYAGNYPASEIIFSTNGFTNNFEGNQQNSSLTYNSNLSSKMGLGAGVYTDKIGVTATSTLFASYSYKLIFHSGYENRKWWRQQAHMISFGFTAGITQYKEDLLSLDINNDNHFARNIDATIPVLGFGVQYNHNNFHLSFSAPNLIANEAARRKNLAINNTYYLHSGYRFFTTKFQRLQLNPSTLIKYVAGSPIQIDTNLSAVYNNSIEFGIGYRSNNTLNVLFNVYISNQFRILYSYNQSLNNNNLNNTHGIVLNYRFGKS